MTQTFILNQSAFLDILVVFHSINLPNNTNDYKSNIEKINSMLKKRLLVLGISGLTGYKIAKKAIPNYDVYGTFNIREVTLENCKSSKLDLTNRPDIEKLFSEIQPDIVINTTALHNVDYCEENREQASQVNTEAIKFFI